jgi:group I intron endonuclease
MINITSLPTNIGIYKITSPSGKVYIGQSINIQKRWKEYKKLYNCKNQVKLYNSFFKYGVENHQFEIIEECSELNLNKQERYWQDYYNSFYKGLNCILTQTDNKSGKLSKETCLKKSESMKGKYIRKGSTHSDESKQLMSNIAKGKPKPWLKGRTAPGLGRTRTENELNKIRKVVIQLSKQGKFIQEWSSIREASIKTNTYDSGITLCCKGKLKTAGGYIWKYKV